MFRYITDLLGFTGVTSSTPDSSDSYPASQIVSCRAWSTPDPDVRLRLTNNTKIQIFGFPRKGSLPSGMHIPFAGFGSNGPPLLQLQGRVPAYVTYIMGDDWRTRLQEGQIHEARIFTGGEVIYRPAASNSEEWAAEEQAHCLRMLRCGAFAARAELDVISGEAAHPELKQIFGWPATGGVWILRAQPLDFPRYDNRSDEEELEAEAMKTHLDETAEKLPQQADMDGVCRVIEEAGGQYYEDMAECPEVVELGYLGW